MQIETRIDAIEARARRVGLSMTELAKRAQIAPSTIFRDKGNVENKLSTLKKINDALIAEERRVLAHLLALHPAQSCGLAGGASLLPTPAVASPSAAGAIYRNGVHP
ncbi:MAG: helix-turn-helix domain-containing protein [Rhabdaerophilum sp.]